MSQHVLFLDAGSAAIDIPGLIIAAMKVGGLSETDAHNRVLMFNAQGAVVADRPGLAAQKAPFAYKIAGVHRARRSRR